MSGEGFIRLVEAFVFRTGHDSNLKNSLNAGKGFHDICEHDSWKQELESVEEKLQAENNELADKHTKKTADAKQLGDMTIKGNISGCSNN